MLTDFVLNTHLISWIDWTMKSTLIRSVWQNTDENTVYANCITIRKCGKLTFHKNWSTEIYVNQQYLSF